MKKNSSNLWYYWSRFIFGRIFVKKKYIIHGVKRRSSSENTQRIDHLFVQ